MSTNASVLRGFLPSVPVHEVGLAYTPSLAWLSTGERSLPVHPANKTGARRSDDSRASERWRPPLDKPASPALRRPLASVRSAVLGAVAQLGER